MSFFRRLFAAAILVVTPLVAAAASPFALLQPEAFAAQIDTFNAMEDEPVVNLVPNAQAWEWLRSNIPFFECPDSALQEIYYFRWWALRKHLRRSKGGRYVFTEFITRERPVSSALGHHLMEGRWLRDQRYHDDYVLYWLRGGAEGKPQGHLHKYSQWLQWALYQRYLVTGDKGSLLSLLPDLVTDYRTWEQERGLESGLFWQHDVWDAMEESISGGRRVRNVRPTINSYMYGNAQALSRIARLAGDANLETEYAVKAAELRRKTQAYLWNPAHKFFEVRREEGAFADVREAIGFIPWYFKLPEPRAEFADAWRQLTDEQGFSAPFGITTAERRHPHFRSHGVGTCEWDGAVWPFATSQTLVALANALRDYPANPLTGEDYFNAFRTYVKSQRWEGKKPYIGEYLDEKTGVWLKGPDPRSRWYNHSTFADLLITGLLGLQPDDSGTLRLHPLLPPGAWDWFCLDGVRYRGFDLTVVWDRTGQRYKRGTGFFVLANGREIARSSTLSPLEAKLPQP